MAHELGGREAGYDSFNIEDHYLDRLVLVLRQQLLRRTACGSLQTLEVCNLINGI